jgi:hypothetical protein
LEVELLTSDIPDDSRRAEKRVKLDSVLKYLTPYRCIWQVQNISLIQHILHAKDM